VDTELFLPELNSGKGVRTECTTGLNMFEPKAWMALLVPGALLGCSPNKLLVAFWG